MDIQRAVLQKRGGLLAEPIKLVPRHESDLARVHAQQRGTKGQTPACCRKNCSITTEGNDEIDTIGIRQPVLIIRL